MAKLYLTVIPSKALLLTSCGVGILPTLTCNSRIIPTVRLVRLVTGFQSVMPTGGFASN